MSEKPDNDSPTLNYMTPRKVSNTRGVYFDGWGIFVIGVLLGFATTGIGIAVARWSSLDALSVLVATSIIEVMAGLILAIISFTRPLGCGVLASFPLQVLILCGICGVATRR